MLERHAISALTEITDATTKYNTTVTSLRFSPIVPWEDMAAFGLTGDVTAYYSVIDGTIGSANFYYKGKPVQSMCRHHEQEFCNEVPTLDILRACVEQDAHRPDITHLDDPDGKRSTHSLKDSLQRV